MSGSGRPRYSTSGGELRAPRYARESVVDAAPPSIATPFRWRKREALDQGLPAEGHGPLRPDLPGTGLPEEVVPHGRARVGGHGARAVLEREQAQVGRPRDYRRRVRSGAGSDVEVNAVVVEAEPGHRRRVPPVQVPGVPAVVDQRRLEVGAVADEPAGDAPQAAGAHRVGDRVDRGERRIARPGGERVHRVAPLRPRGIAAPVQDQVPVQHAVLHTAVRVHGRLHAVVGGQEDRRRRRDDELGVARGNGEAVGVPLVEHPAAVVQHVEPPARAVEGRRVEQLRQPPLERALEGRGARLRPLRRERRANRKRCEDQPSHRARPSRGSPAQIPPT